MAPDCAAPSGWQWTSLRLVPQPLRTVLNSDFGEPNNFATRIECHEAGPFGRASETDRNSKPGY